MQLESETTTPQSEAEQIQQELEKMLQDQQAKLGLPRIAAHRQRLVGLLGDSSNNLKRFDQTIIDYYSDQIMGKEGLCGPQFSKVPELLSSQNTNVPALHAQICAIRLSPLFQDMPAAIRDQLVIQESFLLGLFRDTIQKIIEIEYTQKALALQEVTKNRAGFNAFLKSTSPDLAQVELTTKMMLYGFTQALNDFRDNAVFQQLVLPPIVKLYNQHIFSQALNFGENADYEDVLFALAFYYRLRLITLGFNDYSDELQQIVLEAMRSVKTSPDKQWTVEQIKAHLDQIRLECFENCKNSSLHQVILNPANQSWEQCEEELDRLFNTQYAFVNRRLRRTVTSTLDQDYAKLQFNKRVDILIYGENGFVSKIRGQDLGRVFTALEECIAAQQRLLETDDFSMLAKEDKTFRSTLTKNLIKIVSERFNVGLLVLESFATVVELLNTLKLPEQAQQLVDEVAKLIKVTYRSKNSIDDVMQLMYQYKAILEYTLNSVVFNQHMAPVLAARFESAILDDFSSSIILGCGTNYQETLDLLFTSYRLKLRATADFSDKQFEVYATFLAKLESEKPTAPSGSSCELSTKDQLSQIRVECFSTHQNSPLRTRASEVETLMSQGNAAWPVYSESIEAIFKQDYPWLPQEAVQGFLAQFREKYARKIAEAPQPGVFFAEARAQSPRATQVEEVPAEVAQVEEVLEEGAGKLQNK